MHGIPACVLCGSETTERSMRLVEWTEPIGNSLYAHIPACIDRAACRERVEVVLKEPWPVRDRTPAPVRPAVAYDEPLTPEPVTAPVAEVPPAPEVEEVLPWQR